MDKEKRKEQIMECAKMLFATHGYYNTQISDIIREAGIARGTFYRYFDHKKDLFVTLLEDYYQKWKLDISLEARQLDLRTITPEDYFRHRLRNSLLFFANDPNLCKIALRMGLGLPPDMEGSIQRLENKFTELIEKDLNLGISNGYISPALDVEMTANLIVGSILRLSYFYFGLGEGKKARADVERITEEVAEMFFPGLFLKYRSPAMN